MSSRGSLTSLNFTFFISQSYKVDQIRASTVCRFTCSSESLTVVVLPIICFLVILAVRLLTRCVARVDVFLQKFSCSARLFVVEYFFIPTVSQPMKFEQTYLNFSQLRESNQYLNKRIKRKNLFTEKCCCERHQAWNKYQKLICIGYI